MLCKLVSVMLFPSYVLAASQQYLLDWKLSEGTV
ncbi:hypothetical protein GLYMA_04G031050v4 [Glycine max]|nr:hypothetical protein GLYMA_04G031050v4 [Glycine max]KAH1109526.1 hypothetical protein GYH30_008774 [Glycine max]